jgi:FPC/CPF motif-containing protein YcgG
MFAVQVDLEATPDGVRSLASLFRYLVHYANSTRIARKTLYADILSPSWRLKVEGATLFAIALSPVYPATHHRHTEPASLLLFQPERLFTSFGITSSPARPAISRAVAKRFAQAGRPYSSAHLSGTPKSLRTVRTVEDNAVEWWTSPFPALG